MRFVLVGGGTGGHFYPLIATAEALYDVVKRERGVRPELYFMGPDPYDQGSLFAAHIQYVKVPAGKRRRYFSIQNFIDPFKTFFGLFVALVRLFVIYPDAVLSKGGATSVPVVLAAWILRIPIIIHESDSRPGTANKLAARFAQHIAISYEEAATYFPKEKTILTGIPIRETLLQEGTARTRKDLGIESTKPLVLIIGGSQGAQRINNLIVGSLDELLPHYAILHQTGEQNLEVVKQSAQTLTENAELLTEYYPRAFFDARDMHTALSVADIVISRAGSTSLYEIALHQKPAIVIPIPEGVSQDQRTNAYTYARISGASVLEEENLTPNLLASEIERIMSDQPLRKEMAQGAAQFAKRDAAEKLAQLLRNVHAEHA